MSVRAKATLVASCCFTGGMVYWVHKNQEEERAALKLGVQKDIERQARRAQNRREQDEQIALYKRMRDLEAKDAAATAASD